MRDSTLFLVGMALCVLASILATLLQVGVDYAMWCCGFPQGTGVKTLGVVIGTAFLCGMAILLWRFLVWSFGKLFKRTAK